jgi:hypothetical protein
MVCAAREKAARIEGGFVPVPVAELMAAWRACRSRPLGVGDFRAWLAMREMVARRSCGGAFRHGVVVRNSSEGHPATYDLPELAWLLGVTAKRARASVRRLEAAGLIAWSGEVIVFHDQVLENEELLEDTIGRGRGSVALPRRLLRYLVAGARPAMIATALGVVLRCLSRRRGGWSGRGRVKASWVASTFGVDQRRVKQARKELVALGWIEPGSSGQRAENRWGRAYQIDLAWSPPKAGGRSLPPLPAVERTENATPPSHPEPLPEREKNQEPAERGPTGVEIKGQETEEKPLQAPNLDDVQVEDLRDVGRTLQLYDQAVARKLADPSEAARLRFLAVAEHARVVGKSNPGGLFTYLVRNGCWRYATLDDEDTARRRLREHLHVPTGSGLGLFDATPPRNIGIATTFGAMATCSFGGKTTGGLGLSVDARLVRNIRTAMIRAGILRDPWTEFNRLNPAWDRGRWDAALAELGLA